MAQHNIGHFYGMVQNKPTVTYNKETGAITSANVFIVTVTSSRRYMDGNEDDNISCEQIQLFSGVPSMARQMAELNPYDIIILKGTVNTRNIIKRVTCEKCGEKFDVNGERQGKNGIATSMITFVTPIDIDVRNTELDEEEAMQILLEHREMSNEVQIIGNLCGDPVQWEGGKATSYQLGVNRNFYLRDDDPSISSDYPYVRSYGDQALNDFEALQAKSCVLVDGFLKRRKFLRTNVCPHCGEQKSWTERVLEVIPYKVEYISGYKTGKERAEEKDIAYGED